MDVNIKFKINKKLTFPFLILVYFFNSQILNHRIIVASFVEKGSHTGQAIRNDGFFVA